AGCQRVVHRAVFGVLRPVYSNSSVDSEPRLARRRVMLTESVAEEADQISAQNLLDVAITVTSPDKSLDQVQQPSGRFQSNREGKVQLFSVSLKMLRVGKIIRAKRNAIDPADSHN